MGHVNGVGGSDSLSKFEARHERRREFLINRVFSYPSHHTFRIKPIAALIKRYVGNGVGWVDPFAGETSPAELTNDINPAKPSKYHLPAIDFCNQLDREYEGALFDPPYSLRQLKECYDALGINKISQHDTQYYFSDVKKVLAKKVRLGGLAISCGWSSQGFGKKAGFEIIEILLVCHARSHNDTIVTVERKVHHQEELFR